MRLPASLALILPLALTGCALTPTAAPTPESGPSIQGVVHGGQQVISGAHVYLYAAASSGYESNVSPISSISLLNSNVVTNNPGYYGQDSNNNYYVITNSSGNFSITNDYTCTSGQQVYLYATGGNSGGGANSDIGLMAILGNCTGSFATAIPFVALDEVSTIAAAYAMAGFALDATHVSYSGSTLGLTGITNAFANAANLASISTGLALTTTPAGNGTVPQTTINTLANILAACINSTGSGFTTCSTLFSNSLPGSIGSTATNTATAAINLAHNPYPGATQIANLCGLQVANTPFSPDLPCNNTSPNTYPSTFSISINFTGGGLNSTFGEIAIDGSGNVWITDSGSNSISKFTSMGVAAGLYTGGGLNQPQAIAIDSSGNAWVGNQGTGANGTSVSKFTSTGTIVSGSPFTGGGLNAPAGVAIDGSGNVWVTNYSGNSITELTSAGAVVSGSPFTGSGLNGPCGVAIDSSGNVWVGNTGGNGTGNSVTELASTGAAVSGSPFIAGGLSRPIGIAIDNSGNVWAANEAGNSVTKLSNAGAGISGSPFTGGLNFPDGIAIDGSGNAWVGNLESSNIVEFTSSGVAVSVSPFGTIEPDEVAIDGSGDVWTANGNGNSITEFIGAATPVVTPLVANLITPYSAPASRP